jgi:hypothetical protein
MNNTILLEQKIKNIFAKDFILEGEYPNYYKEFKFVHKTKNIYIDVIIEKYIDAKRIKKISLYKLISTKNSSSYALSEEHSFNFFEDQEYTLKKLNLMKTKICLTQIFL